MRQVDRILDRPIAFHRCFFDLTGSLTATLMLSQAWYWSTRTSDPDGWFYKTETEWEEETALTPRKQKLARESLRKTGFWEEQRKGVPAQLFYRLDRDKIAALLGLSQLVQNVTSSCTETRDQSIRNVTTGGDETSQLADTKGHNIKGTETTTEITAEITAPSSTKRFGFADFQTLFRELLGFPLPINKYTEPEFRVAVNQWGRDAVRRSLERWAEGLGETYTVDGRTNKKRPFAMKNFIDSLATIVPIIEEDAAPPKKKGGIPWL